MLIPGPSLAAPRLSAREARAPPRAQAVLCPAAGDPASGLLSPPTGAAGVTAEGKYQGPMCTAAHGRGQRKGQAWGLRRGKATFPSVLPRDPHQPEGCPQQPALPLTPLPPMHPNPQEGRAAAERRVLSEDWRPNRRSPAGKTLVLPPAHRPRGSRTCPPPPASFYPTVFDHPLAPRKRKWVRDVEGHEGSWRPCSAWRGGGGQEGRSERQLVSCGLGQACTSCSWGMPCPRPAPGTFPPTPAQ